MAANNSLAAINAQLTEGFKAINARLGSGERKFEKLDEKLDRFGDRLGGIESRLTAVETKLGAVESQDDKIAESVSHQLPPWYFSWKPMAIIIALSIFAGAGLGILGIINLDIIPKLQLIKDLAK